MKEKNGNRYCDRCGVLLTKDNNKRGFEICDKCNEYLEETCGNTLLENIKSEIIQNRDRNISGSGNIEEWLEGYRTAFNEALAIIDNHINGEKNNET